MSNTVHTAFYQVYIDGRQYLNKILSLRVSHGYGQDYAEASVNVTADMPSTVGKWSNIVIIMGGTSGTSFTRFNGFVSDFDITLYPVSIAIICKGNLAKAEGVKPEGGSEEDFAGLTDEAVVSSRLTSSDIIPANQNIQGTGRALGTSVTDPGDTRFKQQSNQTNLEVIQQYDQISLGYRTTDSASGVVIRPLVNNIPTDTPAIIVTEGVDIFDATAKIALKVPPNSLEVRGFNAVFSYSQSNDWTPPNLQFQTANIRSSLIESSYASDGIGISAEEVAQYFSGQWFDYKVDCEVTTWRSDLLSPGQTVEVHSPTRLRLNHYLFWLHTVVTEIGEDGTFTQTLSLTSELTDGGPFTPVPIPGMQPPSAPASTPPSDPTYNIDFTVLAVDKEKVIIADVETDLYVVYCEDLSNATSTTPGSRVWTASAGGVPSTGTDSIYVVAFTDLNTATITLDHTYSDAHPGTVTKSLIDLINNVGVKTRKLYTAASDVFEAFDGETWRTDPPVTGIVVTVGNGPIAGTGVAPTVPSCDPIVAGPSLFILANIESDAGQLYGYDPLTDIWTTLGIDPTLQWPDSYINRWDLGSSQSNDYRSINDNSFFAGGPAKVQISPDGVILTQHNGTLAPSYILGEFIGSNGTFYVFTDSEGPYQIYRSTTGDTWTLALDGRALVNQVVATFSLVYWIDEITSFELTLDVSNLPFSSGPFEADFGFGTTNVPIIEIVGWSVNQNRIMVIAYNGVDSSQHLFMVSGSNVETEVTGGFTAEANWDMKTFAHSYDGTSWLAIITSPGSHPNGGLFYSDDRGITWVESTPSGLEPEFVAIRSDGNAMVTGMNAGLLEIWVSTDNGHTWTIATLPSIPANPPADAYTIMTPEGRGASQSPA